MRQAAFLAELSKKGAPRYEILSSLEEVRAAAADRAALKRRAPVLLCAFDSYFPAVATTDIMCRAADVLACKPSELAFYPIPKLMIRRVGDHEQFSAIRAYELGDGTREVRAKQTMSNSSFQNDTSQSGKTPFTTLPYPTIP